MKKFFSILVTFVISTSSANAQASVEQQSFLAKAFPKYMPEYVLKNTEVVPVTGKYAKKHDDVYMHDDLKGNTYPGYIREGDTLLVFNGVPYFSTGQKVFIIPVPKQGNTKVSKQKNAPKTAEERAQNQQMVSQGINILTNVVLPAVVGRRNVQSSGSAGYWGGASLPTGRN